MKYAIIIVEYCHDHKKYDYIGTSIFFKVDQSDIYHLQATIQVARIKLNIKNHTITNNKCILNQNQTMPLDPIEDATAHISQQTHIDIIKPDDLEFQNIFMEVKNWKKTRKHRSLETEEKV